MWQDKFDEPSAKRSYLLYLILILPQEGDRLAIEYETGKVLYYVLEDDYWEPESGWVILPE